MASCTRIIIELENEDINTTIFLVSFPSLQSFGASLSAAKNSFTSLYSDKTGNAWGTKSFAKRPGKFYPLEIDYGQEEGTVSTLGASAGSSSRLAPQIQELIRLIFDVESMKKAMLEFEVRAYIVGWD